MRKVMPVNDTRITPEWMKILDLLIDFDGNDFAYKLETEIEDDLIKIFNKLGINATVKNDKYNLPVEGVFAVSNHYQSFVNNIFNSSSINRQFVKKVLDNDCLKVRFYVYVYTTETEDFSGFKGFINNKFNIEIRYFLHK